MKKNLSVTMVSDDFRPAMTGVGIHLEQLTKELARRGHSVSVITSRRRGEPKKEIWENIHIYRVPTIKIYGFYQALPSTKLIRHIIKTERPDIIHHHYLGFMMKRVCSIAKSLGIPQVSTYHFGAHVLVQPLFMRPFKKIVEQQIVKYKNMCDFVIVPSKNLIEKLTLEGIKAPKRFIPNAITFNNELSSIPPRDNHNTFSILYTGRLATEKNIPLLIAACKILFKSIPKATLDIVGAGPEKNTLVQQAKELGITERVRFHGFIKHDLLAAYYADCDLFVLPSIEEAQPISAIEAMWFRKPIIVTSAIVSSNELVKPGINGYIVNPKSPSQLAEYLITLATDPVLRMKMGEASWEKAQEYRTEYTTDSIESVYQAAIARA